MNANRDDISNGMSPPFSIRESQGVRPEQRLLLSALPRNNKLQEKDKTTTPAYKGNNPKTNERDTAAKDARAERRPNEEGSHFEIKHQVNVILT